MRPGGPGWRRQRERTGLEPAQDLGRDAQRVVAGLMVLFGLMFAVGGALFLRWGTFGAMAALALAGGLWLWTLGDSPRAPDLPEPRTHPHPAGP